MEGLSWLVSCSAELFLRGTHVLAGPLAFSDRLRGHYHPEELVPAPGPSLCPEQLSADESALCAVLGSSGLLRRTVHGQGRLPDSSYGGRGAFGFSNDHHVKCLSSGALKGGVADRTSIQLPRHNADGRRFQPS